MSSTGLHLLAGLVVVIGVLFIKLTLTAWVQARARSGQRRARRRVPPAALPWARRGAGAGSAPRARAAARPRTPPRARAQAARGLLSLLGLIANAERAVASGAPEFAIALRTQLLVGGDTYAIQAQPEYEAAFGRPEAAGGDGEVQVGARARGRTRPVCEEGAAAHIWCKPVQAPTLLRTLHARAQAVVKVVQRSKTMAAAARGTAAASARQEPAGPPDVLHSSASGSARGGGGGPRAPAAHEGGGSDSGGEGGGDGAGAGVGGAASEADAAGEQRQEGTSRGGSPPPPPAAPLTGPQRFRRARANQVVPLPPAYHPTATTGGGGEARRRSGRQSRGSSSSGSDGERAP